MDLCPGSPWMVPHSFHGVQSLGGTWRKCYTGPVMHPLNFAVPSADPLLPEHSSKLLTAVVNCVYINLDPWCGKREQNLLSHVLAAPSAPSSILWIGNLLSLTTRLMVATIFLRKLLLSICEGQRLSSIWWQSCCLGSQATMAKPLGTLQSLNVSTVILSFWWNKSRTFHP